MKGIITKSLAGFYYVDTGGSVIQSRGRGIFRKNNIKPKVGDMVDVDIQKDGDGYVSKIYERKNDFDRPPVANIDLFAVVIALGRPEADFLLTDKLLIMAEYNNACPIICVTKSDIADKKTSEEIKSRYSGFYDIITVSGKDGTGMDLLRSRISGYKTAFAGPSGVGKSTLIGSLVPDAKIKTGDVSEKLRRGKNTTRHVEIFDAGDGCMVFDTPGFTSFDIAGIEPEELCSYYPDIARFEGCRFDDCVHINEFDCAVKDAVDKGLINMGRYESYKYNYRELKDKAGRY